MSEISLKMSCRPLCLARVGEVHHMTPVMIKRTKIDSEYRDHTISYSEFEVEAYDCDSDDETGLQTFFFFLCVARGAH